MAAFGNPQDLDAGWIGQQVQAQASFLGYIDAFWVLMLISLSAVPLALALLATLSPIPVSSTVPSFEMARECRFEAGSTVEFDRCSDDESAALRRLETEWAQFVGVDRRQCIATATIGGFAIYLELLTCLEMVRDLARADDSPRGPTKPQPMQPERPGSTVGVGHGPATLGGER